MDWICALITWVGIQTPHFCQHETEILFFNGPTKDVINTELKWESKIQLVGARGETRSFIVKLPVGVHGPVSLQWNLHSSSSTSTRPAPTPLTSSPSTQRPSNDSLSNNSRSTVALPPSPSPSLPQIDIFKMETVDIKQSSFSSKNNLMFYDPLVPLEKPQFASTQRVTYYWVDLTIPQGWTPGLHRGTLQIGTLPFEAEIKVLNWTLPDQISLPAYTELNPWFVSLAHFGGWDKREEELSKDYFQMLKQHRFFMTKSWRTMPQWTQTGISQFQLNNKSLLVGDSPINIAFDLPVPKDPEGSSTANLRAMEAWVRAQKPREIFIYYIDEPSPAQLSSAVKNLQRLKQWAPSVKIMVTTEPSQTLEKVIDIFVPVMNFYKPTWSVSKGHQLWWYISCMSHGCGEHDDPGLPDFVIDRSDAYVLSIGPLTWQKRIQGFLYFHANYNYQYAPKKDPWTQFYYFTGNGDGDLFYPGKPGERGLTKHGPVPSLRLKLWRETSYLHEYLTELQKRNPNSPTLLRVQREWGSINQWPHSVQRYLDLKMEIAEAIESAP